MDPSVNYIYERLPLILLFMTGYVLYRVIAVVRLPEYLAARATKLSRGRADLLLLSLITVSAGMSMFIPNAVTVLAMIPVIRRLDSELVKMTTPLTLSVIYGANIGGMGSLIGSPANLLLIGALDYFNIEGRTKITFFNWFEWALPLVMIFLLVAWVVVRLSIPAGSSVLVLNTDHSSSIGKTQRTGLYLFGAFILFWTVSSAVREFCPEFMHYEPFVALVFSCCFIGSIFKARLLDLKELLQGIPKRGLIFLAGLAIVVIVVRGLQLDERAAAGFSRLVSLMDSEGSAGYSLYITTAMTVILLTEFLSNTVVSTAFFAVIVHTAGMSGLDPLPLMILVSAASTCAFMTPVATPCNSLAVGEMRGVSLKTMLGAGLLLNILGAGLLSVWIWIVVPLIYS